ncbi:hypothetical protein FA15DRAFT_215076 [Coprinopsis marcescibilis]|uniref:MYND-type domain-containing protein n=1 Tax=Coprinopsis marcescibilis TaxID=230819 RepID=A0A5C3KGT8_COPMA|nr:hypothetical protein FA15DRAFT_215076 [Coprinopsis marcescibilis]
MPPDALFQTKQGFERLLLHVRSGSVEKATLLINNWPTTIKRKIDALEAFLPHLEAPVPSLRPETFQGGAAEWLHSVQLGENAITALDITLIRDKDPDKHSARRLSPIIIGNLDNILSWYQFLVTKNPIARSEFTQAIALAEFIGRLIDWNQPVTEMMLASPCVMDCIILIHSLTGRRGEKHNEYSIRILLRLSLSLLYNQNGNSDFMGKICSLPQANFKSFLSGMMGILSSLSHLAEQAKSQTNPSRTKKLDELIELLGVFQSAIDKLLDGVRIARALLAEDYLTTYCSLLLTLGTYPITPRQRGLLSEQVVIILKWTTTAHGSTVKHLCALLDQGLMSFIVDCLGLAYDHGNIGETHCGLHTIFSYLGLEKVLRCVEDAVRAVEPATLNLVTPRSSKAYVAWMGFKSTVDNHSLATRFRREVSQHFSFCDNLEHHTQGTTHKTRFSSLQTCSRCNSVIYCSVECQATDWNEVHRYECGTLRAFYSIMKLENRWMPHSIRLHHIFVARVLFVRIGNLRLLDASNNKTRGTVIVIGNFGLGGSEHVLQPDEYQKILDVCEFAPNVRFQRMLEIARSNFHLRLVDTCFSFRGKGFRFLCLVSLPNVPNPRIELLAERLQILHAVSFVDPNPNATIG